MLRELYIENLAVIEKASISFTEGFNVFSGETGAGKSILIGAINAVLGGRISRDLIRTGTNKASVTALFDYIPENTAKKLLEYGFETENEILVQREFSIDGKGIVRICGKPSTVSVLREISAELIDIHGQNDTRILTDNNNQRDLLDSFADLKNDLDEYEELFRSFSQLSKRIKRLEDENSEKDERIIQLNKQITEIERLKLKKRDETLISEQLSKARNFEEIFKSLTRAQSVVSGGENSEENASDMISDAISAITAISQYLPESAEINTRLSNVLIEIQDIGSEIGYLIPEADSEQQLPLLEEKMSEILRLKRKYTAELDEILDMYEDWKTELNELSNADNTLSGLYEEKKKLEGLKLTYVGDGNNVTHSLLYAAALSGMNMSVATPKGFECDSEVVEAALSMAKKTGAVLEFTNDPEKAVHNADSVYTDTWVSMGQESEKAEKVKKFDGFQVNEKLMSFAKEDAIFLHCLPAYRGYEVSEGVIDGKW